MHACARPYHNHNIHRVAEIKKIKNSTSMARLLVLGLVAILVVASSWQATSDDDGAPSCASVIGLLSACVGYIENSTDTPPSACCDGVIKVNAMAPTKPDLIAVCNCLKEELPILGKPTDSTRIAHLPHQCGVDRDFPPVDVNYDCTHTPSVGL